MQIFSLFRVLCDYTKSLLVNLGIGKSKVITVFSGLVKVKLKAKLLFMKRIKTSWLAGHGTSILLSRLKMGKKSATFNIISRWLYSIFYVAIFQRKKVFAINFDLQGTATINVIFLYSISYLYNNLLKHAVIGNSENWISLCN